MAEALVTKQSLVSKFAGRYSIEPDKLLSILKATAFKQGPNVPEVSNEQMAALLVVADQFNLNPFTREIYAFFDKQKGIVPVIGVDGFARIISEHPQCDGFEFRESPDLVESAEHKPCPKWMEVVIYRKDRSHPITVREYFDEVYRPPFKRNDGSVSNGPWQSHSKRMMRHKTLIQGGRIALGFTGAFDEDEAQRIIEAQTIEGTATRVPVEKSSTARMADHLGTRQAPAEAKAEGPKPEEQRKPAERDLEGAGARISDNIDKVVFDSVSGAAGKGAASTNAEPAPTLEEIDEMIELMPNKAEITQRVLNIINAHGNQEEQRGLMQRWNAKVLQLKGIKAEQKEPGEEKQQGVATGAVATGTAPAGEKLSDPAPAGNQHVAPSKEKGSAQRLGRIKLQLNDAQNMDDLTEIWDLCRGYEWTADQQKQIDEAFAARKKVLVPE